jgi:hypothetical protein
MKVVSNVKSKLEDLTLKRELNVLRKNEQMVNLEKVKQKHQ